MKLIGIAILSLASIAVLLGVVLPVLVTRILGLVGLGIDIPGHWGWTGTVYGPLSFPLVSLVAGLLLLSLFGWRIWRLTR